MFGLNREKTNTKRIATPHDEIRDIRSVETTIDGKRTLLVSVYDSPNTSFERIKELFVLSLMAYSPKLKGLIEIPEKYNYHEIPTLVGEDLNFDVRVVHVSELN